MHLSKPIPAVQGGQRDLHIVALCHRNRVFQAGNDLSINRQSGIFGIVGILKYIITVIHIHIAVTHNSNIQCAGLLSNIGILYGFDIFLSSFQLVHAQAKASTVIYNRGTQHGHKILKTTNNRFQGILEPIVCLDGVCQRGIVCRCMRHGHCRNKRQHHCQSNQQAYNLLHLVSSLSFRTPDWTPRQPTKSHWHTFLLF